MWWRKRGLQVEFRELIRVCEIEEIDSWEELGFMKSDLDRDNPSLKRR